MRRIVNLFITGLILWIASKIAPEQVQIKDFGTLALATILLWITTIAIYGISLLFMSSGLIFESCSWIILGFFIMAAAKIIALYAISNWISGFNVIGFWPKFWIALACSMFTLSGPSNGHSRYNDGRYE
ncbi:phage holin family protein [Candidatus Saccharibacteria bacterium]|nr:phage holin family protein [Candidatus Saccharibacteria bacterium]